MQGEGGGENAQPRRPRPAPLIHHRHQQEDDARHVDFPHPSHVAGAEIPAFQAQFRAVGIQSGRDRRQRFGQPRQGAARRGGVLRAPGSRKIAPRSRQSVPHFGRQARQRFAPARRRMDGVGRSAGPGQGRNADPGVAGIPARRRHDAKPRIQLAGIADCQRHVQRVDGLGRPSQIAAHLAKRRADRRIGKQPGRNHAGFANGFDALRRQSAQGQGAHDRLAHRFVFHIDRIGVDIRLGPQHHVDIGERRRLSAIALAARDGAHRFAGERLERFQPPLGVHRQSRQRRQIDRAREFAFRVPVGVADRAHAIQTQSRYRQNRQAKRRAAASDRRRGKGRRLAGRAGRFGAARARAGAPCGQRLDIKAQRHADRRDHAAQQLEHHSAPVADAQAGIGHPARGAAAGIHGAVPGRLIEPQAVAFDRRVDADRNRLAPAVRLAKAHVAGPIADAGRIAGIAADMRRQREILQRHRLRQGAALARIHRLDASPVAQAENRRAESEPTFVGVVFAGQRIMMIWQPLGRRMACGGQFQFDVRKRRAGVALAAFRRHDREARLLASLGQQTRDAKPQPVPQIGRIAGRHGLASPLAGVVPANQPHFIGRQAADQRNRRGTAPGRIAHRNARVHFDHGAVALARALFHVARGAGIVGNPAGELPLRGFDIHHGHRQRPAVGHGQPVGIKLHAIGVIGTRDRREGKIGIVVQQILHRIRRHGPGGGNLDFKPPRLLAHQGVRFGFAFRPVKSDAAFHGGGSGGMERFEKRLAALFAVGFEPQADNGIELGAAGGETLPRSGVAQESRHASLDALERRIAFGRARFEIDGPRFDRFAGRSPDILARRHAVVIARKAMDRELRPFALAGLAQINRAGLLKKKPGLRLQIERDANRFVEQPLVRGVQRAALAGKDVRGEFRMAGDQLANELAFGRG
ncbi:MAG: hypothetical protein BWZ10_00253 [candidate division BRC1 bacterium ADurb.BinA364]|nr:MAG: hypothetical protein BWZ10_00253 [candidate division BRC1 bacterium ADurb.BinA364]